MISATKVCATTLTWLAAMRAMSAIQVSGLGKSGDRPTEMFSMGTHGDSIVITLTRVHVSTLHWYYTTKRMRRICAHHTLTRAKVKSAIICTLRVSALIMSCQQILSSAVTRWSLTRTFHLPITAELSWWNFSWRERYIQMHVHDVHIISLYT